MLRTSIVIAAFLMTIILTSGNFTLLDAKTRIQLPPAEQIEGDKKSVRQLEEFYDGIEEALDKKDLDKLMSFYSDDYSHNYVSKAQLRNLWSDTFKRFDNLYSAHIFSAINVWNGEASVRCTGVLMGQPVDGDTIEVVDNWTNTNHYLTMKSGAWQIMGGASRWHTVQEQTVPGEKLVYHLEFHPFF